MRDIRLTQLSNGRFDILLENGKAQWCDDGVQAAQHCAQRLNKYKGESVTENPNESGLDLYGVIFDMKKSQSEKELHIRKIILGTPGITKIIRFEWKQSGRDVTIKALVMTEWGSETIGTTVTQL